MLSVGGRYEGGTGRKKVGRGEGRREGKGGKEEWIMSDGGPD